MGKYQTWTQVVAISFTFLAIAARASHGDEAMGSKELMGGNPLLKEWSFEASEVQKEAQKIFDVNDRLYRLHENDEPTNNTRWDKLGLDLQMEGVSMLIRAVGVST